MTMTIQYNIFDNLTFMTTITLPVASQLIYRVDLSPLILINGTSLTLQLLATR